MSEINPLSNNLQNQSGLEGNSSLDEPKLTAKKTIYFHRKKFYTQSILIALALICIVVLLGQLLESGFLAAMCLLVGIFSMPVFSKELRQDKNILLGYFFVIGLHEIVAFTNAYLFVTYGADFDAGHFQKLSEEFAVYSEWKITNGAQLYTQMLGLVYLWFGKSHLLGEQLSILVFAFSCIILLKIIRLCGMASYKNLSLLAFGALPTMVFLGSVTLRESYQVFSIMLTVFFGLKMHMGRGIKKFVFYLIGFILSMVSMCLLHRGLIGYSMFLVPLFLVWSPTPSKSFRYVKKIRLAAFIIVPIALVSLIIMSDKLLGMETYTRLFSRDGLERISRIRLGPILTPGRTTYGVPFDISSLIMTVYSGLKIYVYYLFAPFPWHVKNFLDVYAFIESIFRLGLIFFSIKYWSNAVGSQRQILGLMLILYFSITLLFSIGTANFGTSIRHHMLSWWIIVITGIPPLMEKLNFIQFGKVKISRKEQLKPL